MATLTTKTASPLRSPEEVSMAIDGKSFAISFSWDEKASYVKPVNKDGKEYREVIAELGNGFGHLHLGDLDPAYRGMYVKLQVSRGNPPKAQTKGSSIKLG